jgi:hypothetical protein
MKKTLLSDKAYDFLKWFAIVGLHLLGVAYAGLATLWNLPYGEAVLKTLDILGVLLGGFLAWESYDYSKQNKITVTPIDDATFIDFKE